MCARARTSVRTRSHSLPLKGLFVQLEAALLGPAMPTITHSPVKMVSAHSSSSKPQTNPLLWGILIGRLEGKKKKEDKMANDMLQSLSSDVSIFSFCRNLWHGTERFDFFFIRDSIWGISGRCLEIDWWYLSRDHKGNLSAMLGMPVKDESHWTCAKLKGFH